MNFNLKLFGGRGGAFSNAAGGEVEHVLREASKSSPFQGVYFSLEGFNALKKEGQELLRDLFDEKAITYRGGRAVDMAEEALEKIGEYANRVVSSVSVISPTDEYRTLRDMIGTKPWYTPPEYRDNVNFQELSRYVRTTTLERDPRTEKPYGNIEKLLSHVADKFPSIIDNEANPSNAFSKLAETMKGLSPRANAKSLPQFDRSTANQLGMQIADGMIEAYRSAVHQTTRRKK